MKCFFTFFKYQDRSKLILVLPGKEIDILRFVVYHVTGRKSLEEIRREEISDITEIITIG